MSEDSRQTGVRTLVDGYLDGTLSRREFVTRAVALAADRFATPAVRFTTLVVRFALVDSPTEKANASFAH